VELYLLMVNKALILAAGKGTRLAPLTNYIPKEMIEVEGKTVIEQLVEAISHAGLNKIQVVLSPNKYSIVRHLGSGSKYGAEITYRIQEDPMGTADAVSICREFVGKEHFLVAYGDTYLENNEVLGQLIEVFDSKKVDFALTVQRVSDPAGFGLIKIDDDRNIIGLVEKPDPDEAAPYKIGEYYLAIRGFLVFQTSMMSYISETQAGKNGEKWLTDSLRNALDNGCRGSVYISKSDIVDIGAHEVLNELRKRKKRIE
jgi:dTDP-glucose pyrophosphorylase